MGSFCEFKNMIKSCIVKHYSDIETVEGCNLHELYEWIDIVKDIAEMELYEAQTKKEKLISESMVDNEDEYDDKGSVEAVIQKMINMVQESINNMTYEEKTIQREKLQNLITLLM